MKRISDINPLQDLSIRIDSSTASTRHSSDVGASCPRCGGAGFVRMDAPVGHPNFARLIPCQCKLDEQESRWRSVHAELSNLESLDEWTFENFDPSVPGVREAYEIAVDFAQNPDGWLYFVGGYGCGKTHLAAAIANDVMKHLRMRAVFVVVPDLLDHLRGAFAPDQLETYDTRFQTVKNADLLVLDDLGTENTTPWAREKLYQLVNYRYNARRPTIITSNRDLSALDGRVASRIADGRICQGVMLNASDYRVRRTKMLRD